MSQQTAMNADLTPGKRVFGQQVDHDIIVVPGIERNVSPRFNDRANDVYRAVAIEGSHLDSKHIVDQGEFLPELIRQIASADTRLQVKSYDRNDLSNLPAMVQHFFHGSPGKSAQTDQSGVIAVIFAISLLSVPYTIGSFNPSAPWAQSLMNMMSHTSIWYQLAYVLLIIFLLLTQVVAWIGSLVFAKLSKKYKTITLLSICIGGYFVASLYGLFIHTMLDFAILAFIVGCFQGSIQSLSRSYYSRIIPDQNSGEYFGLYDIFSKGASVLGSLVICFVTAKGNQTTGLIDINMFGNTIQIGSINLAVAMLCIFFFLGFIFLRISCALIVS